MPPRVFPTFSGRPRGIRISAVALRLHWLPASCDGLHWCQLSSLSTITGEEWRSLYSGLGKIRIAVPSAASAYKRSCQSDPRYGRATLHSTGPRQQSVPTVFDRSDPGSLESAALPLWYQRWIRSYSKPQRTLVSRRDRARLIQRIGCCHIRAAPAPSLCLVNATARNDMQ